MTSSEPLRLAVIGAGPVGLALALLARECLPGTSITLWDARSADEDVSTDPRTLALSLGSVQLLERLRAWPVADAQPIARVHVSQEGGGETGERGVSLVARDLDVPMLGAVLRYGSLVAPLQRAWAAAVQAEPMRLHSRFGCPVHAVSALGDGRAGVWVRSAGLEAAGNEPANGLGPSAAAEGFDVAVIAEGGVFAQQARKALRHDYRQTAWVATVSVQGAEHGLATERFTRQGPIALLPLPPQAQQAAESGHSAMALVWCVPQDDDPVATLTDAQRIALLNARLPHAAGRVTAIGPLKRFALGLNAERTLVRGRQVRIGNAAQTLHPVAGQGLNLGLRDAYSLVQALRMAPDVGAALRRVEWSRAPDRWSMIATTDFLARSFTWQWPGVSALRGLGLMALQAAPAARNALARHMMYGRR